jgi:diguanylate cyclase (GGDEF)-like protein
MRPHDVDQPAFGTAQRSEVSVIVVHKEDLADVLREFARTMVTDFPIQAILDHLVERIVDVLPVSGAGVTLIGPDLSPRFVAASDAATLRFEQLQSDLAEGPCLEAHRQAEVVSVPDLRLETRFPRFSSEAMEAGLAAVFTFPLRHQDVQLGVLDLYRDVTGPMSAESMDAAQALAEVATAYLINAQTRADLEASSLQLREAVLHDPLTGLPNRVLMLELLEQAARAGPRPGGLSAVLFVDLDRFKQVNDTFGHHVGDELLIAVATRLTRLLRPGDSLARMAGDEFVILCRGLENESSADPIALRLGSELARPFVLSGVEVTVSASIGIAFTGTPSDGPEELLRDADLAMYQSKHDDRVRGNDILNLRELHQARHQASLARGLFDAVGRDELRLDYQPIVDARDGRLTGVEALLRWTHPSRGAVPPEVFIPFAERSGQIVEIGRWVLQQACATRGDWERERPGGVGMWVNVSRHQFMSEGFAGSIASVIEAAAVDPALLTLELTESVFVRDQPRTLAVMSEVKAIGVQIALDDFGTGYSSLGFLNALPIDVIKIDQKFIARLDATRDSQAIVVAMISLAHSLGMTVVSEGIETAQQYEQVAGLGSDFCQGFYFARPMHASGLKELIHDAFGGDVLLPGS